MRVEVRAIPEQWPTGPFDLVVLSEIAYYFDVGELNEIIAQVLATTTEGATVVGVHWRGTTNYPLTGDEAHAVIVVNTRAGAMEPLHRVRLRSGHLEPSVWVP